MRLADGQPAWRVKADEAPPALVSAEAARRGLVRAENRRLLYVALTRAKSWLVVCGAGQAATGDGESWHGLVAEAMAGLGAAREPGPDGDVLALTLNWSVAPAAADGAGTPDAAPLPDWSAARGAGAAGGAVAGVAVGLGGAHALPGEVPGELDETAAKARGTAVHRLLEGLHGRPPAERAALAARLLPGEADLAELLAEAAAVLDSPGLAALFGPESLAEVAVAAPLPRSAAAAASGGSTGCCRAAERVLAVDFKSNRVVPAAPEAVPEGDPAADGRLPRGAGARSGPGGGSRRRSSGPAPAG